MIATSRKLRVFSTPYLTRIAVLAAVGAALSMVEIVLLPGAPFYKLDPSGIAVMLAGFSMGFPAGVLTLLIKDLVGLMIHPGGGWVGQLADFIALFAFLAPASMIFHWKKTRGNALIGMILGTVVMTGAAVLANLYILFPAFGLKNGGDYIVPFTVPFNLIKGAALTVITFLIYKPLSPLLHAKIK
ncbi:MAG: ECF transporter S component [Clostridiales bacterium]|nr:ECF transporter S component [Clostridiales bacterium]